MNENSNSSEERVGVLINKNVTSFGGLIHPSNHGFMNSCKERKTTSPRYPTQCIVHVFKRDQTH